MCVIEIMLAIIGRETPSNINPKKLKKKTIGSRIIHSPDAILQSIIYYTK